MLRAAVNFFRRFSPTCPSTRHAPTNIQEARARSPECTAWMPCARTAQIRLEYWAWRPLIEAPQCSSSLVVSGINTGPQRGRRQHAFGRRLGGDESGVPSIASSLPDYFVGACPLDNQVSSSSRRGKRAAVS